MFNTSESARNRAKETKITGRIELPFNHITYRWHNGNPQAADGVAKTGGFKCNIPEWETDSAMMGITNTPLEFRRETLWTREGKSYQVMATPYIYAALIGIRDAWFQRDNGSRQYGMQAVMLTGTLNPETNELEILFPAVIKANGWAGTRIKDAFIKWENITKRARITHADSLPAWFFYGKLGTVFNEGDSSISETVGTGNNQSPITPCQCFEPETITLDYLKSVFIGESGSTIWAEYAESADDWLKSWDRYKTENMRSTAPVNTGGYTPPPPPDSDPNYPGNQAAFDEDEIPF